MKAIDRKGILLTFQPTKSFNPSSNGSFSQIMYVIKRKLNTVICFNPCSSSNGNRYTVTISGKLLLCLF